MVHTLAALRPDARVPADGEARLAAAKLTRAGATVRVSRYATSHRVHPDMLADANRWIMAQITAKAVFGV